MHSVPELTCSADIKLNTRVSLWPAGAALSFSHRILSIRTQHSEAVGRSYSALAALFFEEPRIVADRHNHKLLDVSPPPGWAETWHLWTVIVPAAIDHRRLVLGNVWRRHARCRWDDSPRAMKSVKRSSQPHIIKRDGLRV
jgi:hypothetical protein